MLVNVPFELDDIKAFYILCEVLHIKDLVLSEEKLYIHEGNVCRKDKNGKFEVVDERADLFAALRNVACAHWPNVEFRSDPYITCYCDWEENCETEPSCFNCRWCNTYTKWCCFSNESIDARTNACAMWECDPYEKEA